MNQERFEQLGIEFAFEDEAELREQLKEYHQLCQMKESLFKFASEDERCSERIGEIILDEFLGYGKNKQKCEI